MVQCPVVECIHIHQALARAAAALISSSYTTYINIINNGSRWAASARSTLDSALIPAQVAVATHTATVTAIDHKV